MMDTFFVIIILLVNTYGMPMMWIFDPISLSLELSVYVYIYYTYDINDDVNN